MIGPACNKANNVKTTSLGRMERLRHVKACPYSTKRLSWKLYYHCMCHANDGAENTKLSQFHPHYAMLKSKSFPAIVSPSPPCMLSPFAPPPCAELTRGIPGEALGRICTIYDTIYSAPYLHICTIQSAPNNLNMSPAAGPLPQNKVRMLLLADIRQISTLRWPAWDMPVQPCGVHPWSLPFKLGLMTKAVSSNLGSSLLVPNNSVMMKSAPTSAGHPWHPSECVIISLSQGVVASEGGVCGEAWWESRHLGTLCPFQGSGVRPSNCIAFRMFGCQQL